MKMWGYYAFHTFINSIIKIFRSKFIIVLICSLFLGGVFGMVGGTVAVLLAPEDAVESEEGTEAIEGDVSDGGDEPEEENIIDFNNDGVWDEADIQILCLIVQCAATLLMIGFILMGMYSGSKKGSDIFLMADVNFLFTSPKKPQTVLLFRLSFQMLSLIFISACYVYILPGLIVALKKQAYVGIAIFTAWILLLLLQKLASILTYTVSSTITGLKKKVVPCIYAIAILVVGIHGVVYLLSGLDWIVMLEKIYGSHGWNWFPFVGWIKGAIQEMLDGRILLSMLWFGLLILACIALVWGIWRIKADFYEEAMEGAAEREEKMIAAQEGRKARSDAEKSRKKVQKRNTREVGELRGHGASVFFYKEVYTRRRSDRLGFLSNMMLTYFLVAAVISVIMVYVSHTPNFIVVGLLFLCILFFRTVGNPMGAETSKNWLFLVPDSPYKKVFFSLMANTLFCAIDLLPAMLFAEILLKEPLWAVVLWYVELILTNFVFTIVGMILQSVLPSESVETVKSMIQMLIKAVAILLIIGSFFIGYFTIGAWFGLAISIAVALVISVAGFFIYPARLHKGIA